MNNTISLDDVRSALNVARTLANLQTGREHIADGIGFSNADLGFGRRLVYLLEYDINNQEHQYALALLLRKYRKQSLQLMPEDIYERFIGLATDTDTLAIRQKVRNDAWTLLRNIVEVTVGIQNGEAVFVFTWKGYNKDIYESLRKAGGKWNARDRNVYCDITCLTTCIESLKNLKLQLTLDPDVIAALNIAPPPKPITAVKDYEIVSTEEEWVTVGFPYRANMVAAIKELPPMLRTFNVDAKTWAIHFSAIPALIKEWRGIRLNVAELESFAAEHNIKIAEEIVPVEIDNTDYHIVYADVLKRMLEPPAKHQLVALDFMSKRKKCMLADCMGVGKTLETLMATEHIRNNRPVLIVTKAASKIPWSREIERWFGKDIPYYIVFSKTTTEDDIRAAHAKGAYVIMNYDVLKKYHPILVSLKWDIVIYDEVTEIKNRTSLRSKLSVGQRGVKAIVRNGITIKEGKPAIKGILEIPQHLWVLTGTPFGNHTKDLFIPLKVIDAPVTKRGFESFAMRYCNGERNRFGLQANGSSHLDELRELCKNHMLRRTKEEVLENFPEKRRRPVEVECDLDKYLLHMHEYEQKIIQQAELEGIDIERAFAKYRLGMITTALQICGTVKAPATIELATEIIENDEKLIIFTNYNEPLDLLAEGLKDYNPAILRGGMTDHARIAAQDIFQDHNSSCRVFISNMKAGGMAITLNVASHVIMNDLPFAPYVVRQAEDRAWRMGVRNDVMVDWVLAYNTIDQWLGMQLLEKMNDIKTFENDQQNIFNEFSAEVFNKFFTKAA